MADVVRKIRLHGRLGALFGREHHFVCASPAEAIRALCTMVKGFETELISSKERGVGYVCFDGARSVSLEMLHAPAEAMTIHIAPVIQGSGSNGWVNVLLGVVIIAAAFFTGGASLSLAGGLTFSGIGGAMAFGLGVTLLVTGASQLMMPVDKGLTGVDSVDNGTSYHLNGVTNTTAQGNPVPVLYGSLPIGSAVISAGVYSEEKM